jgi:hypothetical protein
MMSKFWLYLGIILACSGIGTIVGIILIVLYVWGDIRESIDNNNGTNNDITDNNVEEENHNGNYYSEDTAEEMR